MIDNINEMSKKMNFSERKLKKILDKVSKPILVDTHCSFDDKFGVGSSDTIN